MKKNYVLFGTVFLGVFTTQCEEAVQTSVGFIENYPIDTNLLLARFEAT
jgi:hypothetical protein